MRKADEGTKLVKDVFSNYRDSKDWSKYKDCSMTYLWSSFSVEFVRYDFKLAH